MTGNSGAKFEFHDDLVVKSGGSTDLVKQYNLCLALGSEVCPRVFDASQMSNSYSMERLVPGPPPDDNLLFAVFSKLCLHVWPRPLKDPRTYCIPGWIPTISFWCREHAPWIFEICDPQSSIYSIETDLKICLTHGDPTLANVMRRRDGSGLVLIDPMPPRPGIPSLREVDVGKLLQSVAGWESVVSGDAVTRLKTPPVDLAQASWDSTSGVPLGLWRARCYFWAAVACARVVRHGTPSEAVRKWSREASEMYAKMLGDELVNV